MFWALTWFCSFICRPFCPILVRCVFFLQWSCRPGFLLFVYDSLQSMPFYWSKIKVNKGVSTGFEPMQSATDQMQPRICLRQHFWETSSVFLILNLFSLKRKKCKHRGDNATKKEKTARLFLFKKNCSFISISVQKVATHFKDCWNLCWDCPPLQLLNAFG